MPWYKKLRLFQRVAALEKQMSTTQTQIAQIQADLTATKADLESTKTTLTTFATDFVSLHSTITALQAQAAAGQPVDLTALVAQADDLKTDADAVLAQSGTVESPTV